MLKKLENNYFIKNGVLFTALVLLIYSFGFAFWTIGFTETANGDNVEHIHSTWLVAFGNVPYRDFFQHHNPLLWYIFAPFVRLFAEQIVSNQLLFLDIAHAAGVVAGIITFFFAYKISTRFFAGRLASLLALLVMCPPYFYIYCFNYNPDTYMALSLAGGLYLLFKYFDKAELVSLVGSFFCFFLAFLFTQKILIILGQLGVISLYVFYKKKTPVNDILFALMLPLCGLLLFVGCLYNADALELYWKSNYPFNMEMQKYYGFNKVSVVDYEVLCISAVLSVLSVIIFIKSNSLYHKIFAFLFVTELLQRCFYFAISPYYMLPLMIFMLSLNAELIDKVSKKCFILSYVFIGVAVFYAGISVNKYMEARGTDRSFARFIVTTVTPCDYVLNSFLGNQSIINKNMHYYWAMLGHIDLAGESLNIASSPDVNKLVSTYKPKIVYGGVYWNNYYKNRGRFVPSQQVSPELIEHFYIPAPFADMYVLKYEYRQKNCYYDTQRGDWFYEGQ